jgi:HK97 family phage major capsid protein
MRQVTELGADIQRREQLETMEHDLQQSTRDPQRGDPAGAAGGAVGTQARSTEWRSRGLRGLVGQDPEWQTQPEWQTPLRSTDPTYARAYRTFLRRGVVAPELRALQADSDTLGGYMMAPMQMVDRLIEAVDNLVYIRQWASVFAVPNADSLGVPSLDTDVSDPAWTTELATGTEDSSVAFGRRELHPHPLAKRIKISRKLLAKVPDSEALVIRRLAYKFGVTQEAAFLTGSGAGQPLGVFTASVDGIPVARDYSTGNAQTAMTFDGLIGAKYTLKSQYWPNARWMFHRDGVAQIAKLKDGNGQYIWRDSVQNGDPDRLLGLPVAMSEYAPNTFTAGLYVGILGDFSNYWIADSMAMDMQRLVELYAESNQVGLIGRLETDGMPVLGEAFVRVKLAP